MSEAESTRFTDKMLLELARDQRRHAYAPYSNFTVGAACTAGSGVTYVGSNVENTSFPVGICAERAAIASAVAHGESKVTALAVAGGMRDAEPDGSLRPCGMCLQFLSEFMEPDGKILIAEGAEGQVEYTLGELLPAAFHLSGPDEDGR